MLITENIVAPRNRMSAYHHPYYAESLAEFGQPRRLERSDGWILERQIPSTSDIDATGCYPLFSCGDWSKLESDFDELDQGIVSLAVVADPFGDYTESGLRRLFPDLVKPFKRHYVVDLGEPLQRLSSHHRRNVKKGMGALEVEICEEPAAFLDDWTRLYEMLVERHAIEGVAAFSRVAFEKQLAVPGMIATRAMSNERVVGMALWCSRDDQVSYYHLAAYDQEGYEKKASFAIFWTTIQHLAETGQKWLNLGGGAGLSESEDDGLSRFKRGWATTSRTAYLCGRIFDRERYDSLCACRPRADYFPLYRSA